MKEKNNLTFLTQKNNNKTNFKKRLSHYNKMQIFKKRKKNKKKHLNIKITVALVLVEFLELLVQTNSQLEGLLKPKNFVKINNFMKFKGKI